MSTFWSNFKEIHEFHIVRLISGRSVGDVVGRRFGCAYPSQIDDLARSREKKIQNFASRCILSLMATLKLLFWQCLEDSLWIYRCSVAIAGVAAKIGIKFLHDTKRFQMIFMMVTFNAMSTLQSFAIFHEIWWVWVQEVQVHPGAGSAPKAPFTQV